MQQHTKIYFKHYGIAFNESGWHDPIKCEVCGCVAIDIHHINGRWNKENSNDIKNLIALCRRCHNDAHSGELTKGDLHVVHNSNLY